jgi:CrcB protein
MDHGIGLEPHLQANRRSPHAWARPSVLIAIAAGGSLGAPARYALTVAIPVSKAGFPWATFWTNISGSFALGLLLTLVVERWPPTRFVRPFAAVGFLGAFTTWSTFVVDSDELLAHGHVAVAGAYLGASLVCGLGAVYVGIVGGRMWPVTSEARR